MRNLLHQLTYLLKSFWPEKSMRSGGSGEHRDRDGQRIRNPFHTQHLLWLDRQRFTDIAIFSGCRLLRSGALKLAEPKFVIEVAAALLTSMLAAAAAFCAGCPGRPLWERFAPLPALALWLGTLGTGCWQSWLQRGPEGLVERQDSSHTSSHLCADALPEDGTRLETPRAP